MPIKLSSRHLINSSTMPLSNTTVINTNISITRALTVTAWDRQVRRISEDHLLFPTKEYFVGQVRDFHRNSFRVKISEKELALDWSSDLEFQSISHRSELIVLSFSLIPWPLITCPLLSASLFMGVCLTVCVSVFYNFLFSQFVEIGFSFSFFVPVYFFHSLLQRNLVTWAG